MPLPVASRRAGVATGNNQQNLTGQLIGSPSNRLSQVYIDTLPANYTKTVAMPGTTFYVGYCTAPINIRPRGGAFNTFYQGTGVKLETGFTSLEVYNANAYPVLIQVFVGFDEFIDHRVIIDYSSQPLVAVPLCPVANAQSQVLCPDLSTQAITDINGGKWWAISREALYVFNPDTGITLLLQQANSAISNGPAVAVIYPQTTLRYPASGNFSLSLGGANLNAIVSDVYYSLPRSN